MGALLHNLRVVQHDDAAGFLHCGQAVRNHQGGAAQHGRFQRGLHHAFAFSVEGAGGFVQQQQRRVFQHGPRNGDALALAARQAHAAFAQKGLVALGQCLDETIGKRRLCSGVNLCVGGLWLAVADVLHGVGRENDRVLWHDANALAQAGQSQRVDGHAIQQDTASIHRDIRVVKPQQQLEHGAFAGTAGAYQGHRFPSRHIQRKAVQSGSLRPGRVMETDVVELHPATALNRRQPPGAGWRLDRRLPMQQLHQALGGPCRPQQVAIHLAQHGKSTGQDDDVHHGLAQVPGADAPGHNRLGALVQAPQQCRRRGNDDERHQHRTCPGAAHGSFEGVVGRGLKTL